MTGTTRVLGLDASLRSTGVAVVEARGNVLTAVEYGALRTPAGRPLTECLRRIAEGVAAIIERTGPRAAAIEGSFFQKNERTAMILGQARGAAIAMCACRGLAVYEYAPRRVKQAVVGFGGAEKAQVRRMVMSLLGLPEEPQEDAGDALAIAICHLNSRSLHPGLMPKSI